MSPPERRAPGEGGLENEVALPSKTTTEVPDSQVRSDVFSKVRAILRTAAIEPSVVRRILHRLRTKPCLAPGEGINPRWLPSTCGYLHWIGVPSEVAIEVVTAAMTRDPRAGEIERAWTRVSKSGGGPVSPTPKVEFEPETLERAIVGVPTRTFTQWRHWLWERSALRPESLDALGFIEALYRPGEHVAVLAGSQSAKTRLVQCGAGIDREYLTSVTHDGYDCGVWFQIQPLDGEWHRNPRGLPNPRNPNNLSCRSEESVTSYRYALLESDETALEKWLALISTLKAKIAAIYTSGGKSVHTLLRVDAASKTEWEATVHPLKGPLGRLGADLGALTAVRLSRLPCCWRREKQGFQKLLFINPDPAEMALQDLPIKTRRSEYAAMMAAGRQRATNPVTSPL